MKIQDKDACRVTELLKKFLAIEKCDETVWKGSLDCQRLNGFSPQTIFCHKR